MQVKVVPAYVATRSVGQAAITALQAPAELAPALSVVPASSAAGPAGASAPVAADGLTSVAERPAGPRAPWYLDKDALGEAAITGVDPWSTEDAQRWAHEVGSRVRRADDGPELSAGIQNGLREVLGTDDTGGKSAEKNIEKWETLLQNGRFFVAGGHLVWIRPVLRDASPGEQPTGDVRSYGVSFASMSSGGKSGGSVTRGFDALLLSFLGIGSRVASAVVPGLPAVTADASVKKEEGHDRQVIAGRKLFVAENTRFRSGLAIRVFVDGVERPNDVVLPQRFDVDFPAPFTAPDAPRPEGTMPPTGAAAGVRRPSQATEAINAVDLIPVVADVQLRLLGAGLPAESVRTVMGEVTEYVNEKSTRNRSRVVLSSGVPTKKVTVPTGPLSRFEGHFSFSAQIERLQYIGDSEVTVREDSGVGLTVKPGQEGESKAATGFYFSVAGLDADPGAHLPDVEHAQHGTGKGFVRGPSFMAPFSRGAGHGLSEQGLGHAVLNRGGKQSRYRTGLRVDVDIRSATHPIDPVSTVVEAETSVPKPEAADFEKRMTGAVRAPADSMPPPSAFRRPRNLDRPIQVDPAHREPLALAARRGVGFGMPALLPGSELVHQQIRAVLQHEHDAVSGGKKADWSQADLDLVTYFSRPALEADLPAVMAGVDHTVHVGGRAYEISVQAQLRERIGGDTYPMTVNGRALLAAATAGHRNTEIGAELGWGGGVRFTWPWMRFVLGAWSAHGEYSYTAKREFGGSAKSYRRTETTGQVDEHDYNVIYQVSVRPAKRSRITWWIDRPEDVTARIVVPEEHRPATPLTAVELQNAGTVSTPAAWPDEDVVDLEAGGASGVYPSFFVIPELPRLAARLYAEANGLPARWADDRTNWPSAIKDLNRPDKLAQYFPALTGKKGRIVSLPRGRDGLKQAFRIRLRGYRPRHAGASGSTEIEQYAQGTRVHKYGGEHKLKGGSSFAAGPQLRMGSEAGKQVVSPEDGPETGHSAGGEHEGSMGGRVQVTIQDHAGFTWKKEQSKTRGNIGISRATYGGTTHTYRTDPVFEVTLIRWRRGYRSKTTRYLRATDAMDLLIPQRRIFDLGLTAPGVTRPVPQAPTRHVPPGLLPGMSYPETMNADQVLDKIKQQLRHHGVLKEFFEGEDRPNLLAQELDAAFSGDALRNNWRLLTGSGVTRWIPVPQPFGGTRYVFVRVTAAVGTATSQLPRPEVKLTLRDEGQREESRERSAAFTYGGGADVRGRVGRKGHGDGHGGVEAGVDFTAESSHGTEAHEKTLKIYRAGTREGSLEFEHPLAFRIEVGLNTELPELLNVPVRGLREAVIGLGRLAADPKAGDRWYSHRPFVWHTVIEPDAPDGVTGDVRLLVPQSIAILDAPPVGLKPALGDTPAWDARPPWEGQPEQAIDALTRNLHPWGVPFAAAVERWAALPASPYRLPDDLSAPGAWNVPGLDFTTIAGLRYLHFTSQELIRPYIKELLNNVYEVPVGSRETIAGLEITGAEPIGPLDGTPFKGRIYTQESEAEKEKTGRSKGFRVRFGPEGGGDVGDAKQLGIGAFEYGRDAAEEQEGELGGTDEKNKEATRRYRHYRFDVALILTGRRGTLRVPVPDGMYGMLPLEQEPDGAYRLADDLENALPHLFGPRPADAPVIEAAAIRWQSSSHSTPDENGITACVEVSAISVLQAVDGDSKAAGG
ncbi:hypothetical protein [Actinoallomurus soli]|uniref:hypothetical protein n=1 Tax=Actinoallomurus soli TaxID=2952535 RepID=UPI00209327A5|nr:hypothetical protein [Actinoallomurus soli]MCO5975019.1 hypothetical protein [Actinoallomurus soli]